MDEDNTIEHIPILGRPRYGYGDIVRFVYRETEKIGKISIIDAYGTWSQREESSYDIFLEEENCLYQHICESDIVGKN